MTSVLVTETNQVVEVVEPAAVTVTTLPADDLPTIDVVAAGPQGAPGTEATTPDASATIKGMSKLSVAPVLASNPIAAGTNDTRFPAGADIVNADIGAAAAIAETKLALASDAVAATASRRTLGTGATQAAAGTDARLSDARAPTTHKATHAVDGSDALSATDLGVWPQIAPSGNWFGTAGPNVTTGPQFNNAARAAPLLVPRSLTLDRIAVEVTAAGNAGATLRLAIYSDTSGFPGSVVLNAGTVAGDSTGLKEVVISQALTPGVYWLVCLPANAATTAPTIRVLLSTVLPVFSVPEAGKTSMSSYAITGHALSMPSDTLISPWTTGANYTGSAPRVLVRVA